MSAQSETTLSQAIRDHLTTVDADGDECVMVVRSFTVAEVIYSGLDGTYPAICATGVVPPWAAAGLLAQAKAIVDADLVNHFHPTEEDE